MCFAVSIEVKDLPYIEMSTEKTSDSYSNPIVEERQTDKLNAGDEERIDGTLYSKMFVLAAIHSAYQQQLKFLEIPANDSSMELPKIDGVLERLAVLNEICISEPVAIAKFVATDETSPLVIGMAQILLSLEDLPSSQKTLFCQLAEIFTILMPYVEIISETEELRTTLTQLCLHVLRWMDPDVLKTSFCAMAACPPHSVNESLIVSTFTQNELFPQIVEFILNNSLRADLLKYVWRLIRNLSLAFPLAMLIYLPIMCSAIVSTNALQNVAALTLAEILVNSSDVMGSSEVIKSIMDGGVSIAELLTIIKIKVDKCDNGILAKLSDILRF